MTVHPDQARVHTARLSAGLQLDSCPGQIFCPCTVRAHPLYNSPRAGCGSSMLTPAGRTTRLAAVPSCSVLGGCEHSRVIPPPPRLTRTSGSSRVRRCRGGLHPHPHSAYITAHLRCGTSGVPDPAHLLPACPCRDIVPAGCLASWWRARSRSLAGQLLCAHSRLISAGRPGASPPLASATLLLPPSMLLFCGCYCCSACMMGGETSKMRGAMRACDALLCMRVHALVLLCVLFCARAAA